MSNPSVGHRKAPSLVWLTVLLAPVGAAGLWLGLAAAGAAGVLAGAALLGAVWLSQARAARRRSAVLEAYAERELARRSRRAPQTVRG